MPTSNNKRKDGKTYGIAKVKPHELQLPSIDPETGEHNVCLVRRPGPQGLVKMGLLDSLDSLTGIVASKILEVERGNGVGSSRPSPEGMKALAENKENLATALDVIDRIIVGVVIKPAVLPVPTTEEERDEDALYVDEVDLEDKVFIMDYAVGGAGDWASFRERAAANVAAMEGITGVRGDSEQPAGG